MDPACCEDGWVEAEDSARHTDEGDADALLLQFASVLQTIPCSIRVSLPGLVGVGIRYLTGAFSLCASHCMICSLLSRKKSSLVQGVWCIFLTSIGSPYKMVCNQFG
eukprot:XP_001708186.1 Hypothetical protein GL50803_32217 [Giardia lamblia ATCC 50803]